MIDKLPIINERVDDFPLLQAQVQRMGLPSLSDDHFPTCGNWQRLSLGEVTVIQLTHLLTVGDHWLNHVEPWMKQQLETLRHSTGQLVQARGVVDDRLQMVLQTLRDDARWKAFEAALNRHVLWVYAAHPEWVRVDSTSASGS